MTEPKNFDPVRGPWSDHSVEDRIALRHIALKDGNVALAHRVHNHLRTNGIIIEDTPDGKTKWRRADQGEFTVQMHLECAAAFLAEDPPAVYFAVHEIGQALTKFGPEELTVASVIKRVHENRETRGKNDQNDSPWQIREDVLEAIRGGHSEPRALAAAALGITE